MTLEDQADEGIRSVYRQLPGPLQVSWMENRQEITGYFRAMALGQDPEAAYQTLGRDAVPVVNNIAEYFRQQNIDDQLTVLSAERALLQQSLEQSRANLSGKKSAGAGLERIMATSMIDEGYSGRSVRYLAKAGRYFPPLLLLRPFFKKK
jgi:hypothetical protein